MRTTDLRFDELNSLSRETYEEFFDVMPISQDQKTDRVLIAMALEDRFLDILSLVEIRQKRDEPWLGEAIELFTLAFLAVATRRIDDDEIRVKAERFGQEVGLSTFQHQGEEYMTSADRAINMAATESNAIMCYGEIADAIKQGMTRKTWRTIIDGRERDAHHEVNGTTIPITEPFEVGGELLMYPLDDSLGASADNIANCRCCAIYS
jgi:hypothetical protein